MDDLLPVASNYVIGVTHYFMRVRELGLAENSYT